MKQSGGGNKKEKKKEKFSIELQFAHQSAIKSPVSARAHWHTDKTELIAARILCLRESQFVFKSLGNKSRLWLPQCDSFFATALPSFFLSFVHSLFFGRPKPNKTTAGRLKPKQKNAVAFLPPRRRCSIPIGMSSYLGLPPLNACGAMQHGEVCATAWWSILFILKWGRSWGRYIGEWNNKHEALRRRKSARSRRWGWCGGHDSKMATPPYKVALRTSGRVIIRTVASRRGPCGRSVHTLRRVIKQHRR